MDDWRARRQPLTRREHQRHARRYRMRRALWGYVFIAPSLFFFVIFLAVPCGWVVYTSLTSGGVTDGTQFVGLKNWAEALKDPLVRTTLKNSAHLALLAIPAVFALGMSLALFLQNIRRGSRLMRTLLYFPTLAPLVIVATIWLFVVQPDFGLLNVTVRALGGHAVDWLGNPGTALPTIALIEVWRGVGFWTLFFLAGLVSLPSELFQAARLDGANALQRFRHVTLPLLRPTLLFAVVLAIIYNLQLFDTVFLLTNGGPANGTATVVWYVYESIYVYNTPGYGATLSLVSLVVIVTLTVISFRFLRPARRTA
jgi:ABC-type sugar transport system permease subunit